MDVGTESTGPGRTLIVHHRRSGRRRIARTLRAAGYEVTEASDVSEETMDAASEVDLLLLHVGLPGVDGRRVTRRIRDRLGSDIPIVLLAPRSTDRAPERVAAIGATDFLSLPVDPEILKHRCDALVRLKRVRDRLADQKRLAETVARRERELRRALEEVASSREEALRTEIEGVRRLVAAAEHRDPSQGERVGAYAARLAQSIGMSAEEVDRLRLAAPLRNVGNVLIPDAILLKPTALDDAEMKVMRGHTTRGAKILSDSSSSVLQVGEKVARTHHERWDGSGYPLGLQGEEIPLEGRICAIVDFFDALTSDRPYRGVVPTRRVLRLMREESGSHFDPDLLEAFMDNSEDFTRMALH
jgi:putative two-component system response regulator